MKMKQERTLKVNLALTKKFNPLQVLKEKKDETYQQVNQLSFQKNFKALIGHFKTSDTTITF